MNDTGKFWHKLLSHNLFLVGQLAAAAFKYGPECTAAVVIGYGCNSSYLEDTEKITKFNAKAMGYNHKKMVNF
jgi:hexokinase